MAEKIFGCGEDLKEGIRRAGFTPTPGFMAIL
jgi:hypothetical protein